VIDIGSLSSHGAIVCREMGLPCVINTGNGTSVIRTGDRIRVDGDNGVVRVLVRAGSVPD
jgi:pyruvate,water dikinase